MANLAIMVQCSPNSQKIALIAILLENLVLTRAHIPIFPLVLTIQGITNLGS